MRLITIFKKYFFRFVLLIVFLNAPQKQFLFAASDDFAEEAGADFSEEASFDEDFAFEEPTPTEELPTEEPAKEEPMRFNLPMPHFGTIVFEGSMNINTGGFKFTGYPSKKELDLGLIKIKNPNFSFSMETGLQMSATAVFLEKELTTTRLEKFELGQRVILSIALPEPLKIPISLTKSLSFEKLYIELTGTKYSIYTTTSLTGKPTDIVKLELGLEKIPPVLPAIKPTFRPFIDLSFTQLSLSAFVEEVAGTLADKIVLKSSTGRITDPFNAKAEHIITLSGAIDFGDFKIPPLTLDNLTYAATIKTKTGLSLEVNLGDNLSLIPNLLTIKNPKIAISNLPPTPQTSTPKDAQQKLSFIVSGSVNLDIPPIGKINTTITADVKDGKLEYFEGALNRPVNFLNIVKISDTKVIYSVTKDLLGKIKKEFEVAGNARALDNDITAHLKIDKKDAQTTVTFEGELKAQKPLKPFEKIPGIEAMPALKNITLVNIGVSLDTKKTFFIHGFGSILDINCKIKLITTPSGVAIKGEPLEETALVKIIPSIKGTPLESFNVPKFTLIASTSYFQDPDTGIFLPKGLSIQSSIDTANKNLDAARFLLQGVPPQLFLSASIGTEAIGFTLIIPTAVKLSDNITLEQVSLLLSVKGPLLELGAKTHIRTRLPEQNSDTIFSGEIDIGQFPTPHMKLTGAMQGDWKNAFGQQGVDLRNVGLEFEASTLPAPPFIVPTRFGFIGTLLLGASSEIAMAILVSAQGDFAAMGKFDGTLNTNDLFFIPLTKGGVNIPTDKLPSLTIKDVEVKIAPRPVIIAGIPVDQGLTLKGEMMLSSFGPLDFSGVSGKVKATIDMKGIDIQGSLSTIKLFGESLKITGAGLDKQSGTADDGPVIKFVLTPSEQLFFASGLIELFGSKSQTEVTISPQQVTFKTQQKFAGLFDLTISGKSSGSVQSKNLDFTITGELNSPKPLQVKREDLDKWNKNIETVIQQKRAEYKQRMDYLNSAISKREDTLYKTNKTYKSLKDAFDGAEKTFNNAQDEVKKLDRRINQLKKELGQASNDNQPINQSNRYRHHPASLLAQNANKNLLLAWDPIGDIRRAAEKAAAATRRAAEKAAADVKRAAEQAAAAAKRTAEQAAAAVAREAERAPKRLELAGLETARTVALGTLETAKQFVNSTGDALKAFTDKELFELRTLQAAATANKEIEEAHYTMKKGMVASAIATYPVIGWLTDVSVKHLTVSASASGFFTRGELPAIECTSIIHGKTYHFKFTADIDDLLSALLNAIVNKIK